MPRPPIGRRARTVDTAHAMVAPTTTREVLYVSATRGKEANRLYVDTHYDPDPQTSHDETLEPMTAKEVLAGVLRNEGAEVAAHEMIRREQHEAEGMERLSAEYLTLATEAQAERWDALLARSGLSDADLATVAASAARGPLFAGIARRPKHAVSTSTTALPQLVAGRSLADAADVASVLHGRVDRWSQAAGGRRRHTGHLIAGLIPRAQGVTDPDMARALAERDHAMEQRARSLAEEAIAAGHSWVRRSELRRADQPSGSAGCEKCRPSRPTGTAGTSRVERPLGAAPDRGEPRTDGPAQEGAGGRGAGEGDQHGPNGPADQSGLEPQVEISQGVEL